MSDRSLLELAHSCPQCHRGPLFAGVIRLHTRCDACGLAYEREDGQLWGAMVLAYGFGALIAVPLFLALLVNRASPLMAIGIPVAALTLLAPLNIRVSRLVWTHAMYHLHRGPQRG